VQEKDARIDVLAVETINEGLAIGVPTPPQDVFAQAVGGASPRGSTILKPETAPDAGKPVAGCPAHGRGVGVDARAAAKLPDAGVWLQRLVESVPSELFQHGVERFVAFARQALVEEQG
jgi:hypothetical protein